MRRIATRVPVRILAVRVVAATVVAGSAAVGFVPIAAASEDTTLSPSVEGWYQPNPSCATPAGCVTTGTLPVAPPAPVPAPPASSPYPAGSMHVGIAAGQEVARSYLAFPFSQLEGRTVQSGTLSVPLDVAPADGSNSPETSKVLVCLTTSPKITASEGSIDPPPAVDCGSAVTAKYVATPQPHLQADLGSLASELPSATGLVLQPDATKSAQTDAWRVVFSSHTRADAAKTPPATLMLTLADLPPISDGGFVAPPVAEVPTGTGISVVPPGPGTGFAAPPVTTPVDIAPPTVSNPNPTAVVPTATPRLVTVGYAYPAVWLLPLAFLVLIPAAAKALTRDLGPVAV